MCAAHSAQLHAITAGRAFGHGLGFLSWGNFPVFSVRISRRDVIAPDCVNEFRERASRLSGQRRE
jgi:hypothetical protein